MLHLSNITQYNVQLDDWWNEKRLINIHGRREHMLCMENQELPWNKVQFSKYIFKRKYKAKNDQMKVIFSEDP